MSLILFIQNGASFFTVNVSDTVTVSDSVAKTFTHVQGDTVTVTDSTTHTGQIVVSDTVTVSDAIVKFATKVQSDTVSTSDAQPKTVTKPFSDTVSSSDAQTKTFTKVQSDSVSSADAVLGAFVRVITVSDVVAISDLTNQLPAIAVLLAPQAPAVGLVSGGTAFTVAGTALDMTSAQDNFNATPLNTLKWSNVSSGSGAVSVIPMGVSATQGVLQFDTGSTPGSVARVRTLISRTEADAEVTAVLSSTSGLTGTAQLQFSVVLYNTSASNVRLNVVINSLGVGTLTVAGIDGGQPVVTRTLSTTFSAARGAPFRLRLLHTGSRTIGFVSGQEVFDIATGVTSSVFEISALNDAVQASRLVVSVQKYNPIPVILFGTEPAQEVAAISRYRADGFTPPQTRDQTVNITVASAAARFSIPSAFQYAFDPTLTPVRVGVPTTVNGNTTHPGQLTIVSDPSVTGSQR